MRYDKNYTNDVVEKYKNISQDDFKKVIPGTNRGTYRMQFFGTWIEGILLDDNAGQFPDVCTLDNDRFVAIDDYHPDIAYSLLCAEDDVSGSHPADGECRPIIHTMAIDLENNDRTLLAYWTQDYARWSDIACQFGNEARAFEHSALRKLETERESILEKPSNDSEEDYDLLTSRLAEVCTAYRDDYLTYEHPEEFYNDFEETVGDPLAVLKEVCNPRMRHYDVQKLLADVRKRMD